MLVRAGRHEMAVRRDDAGTAQAVRRQAELALEPARAGAEREAGDAHRGKPRARHREPVLLRGGVDLAPGGAALDADAQPRRIHSYRAHRREVDDEGAVVDREAVRTVAAAAYAHGQPGRARVPQGRDHVARAAAARDDRGRAVDRVVLGAPRVVERGITGQQEVAGEVTDGMAHTRDDARAARRIPGTPYQVSTNPRGSRGAAPAAASVAAIRPRVSAGSTTSSSSNSVAALIARAFSCAAAVSSRTR